jgi:uncharacterized membrane protein YfcA
MLKVKKKPNKPVDYEKLGKMLEAIYETGYSNRKKIYRMSFLKGVAAGFGGVIGATIIVAILLWVLSLFDQVPLIGPFTDKIHDTVQIKNN